MPHMKKIIYFFLTALAVVTCSCSSSTTPSTNTSGPKINSFVAIPSTITIGDKSVLMWSIEGTPTSVTIDQGVGDQTSNTSDSVVVTPSDTTKYTLTAKNDGGTSTATITVN